MNLLLDTHALLWFISGESKLSENARRLIEDATNDKFVSIASLWEIAIKVSIGKMPLTGTFDDLFPQQLKINGFGLLPISVEHVSILTSLPFHHRDPFDRLLVAQSMADNMDLLSVDNVFDNYIVNRIW